MCRGKRCIQVLAGVAAVAAGDAKAAHPAPTVIYQNYRLTAGTPMAPLTVAANGSLYGTAASGGMATRGMAFRLDPPAAGQTSWTGTILHSFSGTPDGALPLGSVLVGRRGELFGTTAVGGTGHGYDGSGTVWRLHPPTSGSGAWTEDILYRFQFVPKRTGPMADGGYPSAGLVMDRTGTLFGTTDGGGLGYGTVFSLSPPQRGEARWTETVLYRFTGGADGANAQTGLSIDRQGILYGATGSGGAVGNGTVFQLAPPAAGQTEWTESVLHSFTGGQTDGCEPFAAPTLTAAGTLYGTTPFCGGYGDGNGIAYQLNPPASGQSTWTETVLWHFGHHPHDGLIPYGSLVFGQHGILYGTTFYGGARSGGTVFQLVPPTEDHPEGRESVLSFLRRSSGVHPWAGLAVDATGHLYGTTSLGGAHKGGTVFEIIP
jgi:uncharacterized repeat protein (TIGR03803 family)